MNNRYKRIMTHYRYGNYDRLILGGDAMPYHYYRLWDLWLVNGWMKYLTKDTWPIWEAFASAGRKDRHVFREYYLTLLKYVKLRKRCEDKGIDTSNIE